MSGGNTREHFGWRVLPFAKGYALGTEGAPPDYQQLDESERIAHEQGWRQGWRDAVQLPSERERKLLRQSASESVNKLAAADTTKPREGFVMR